MTGMPLPVPEKKEKVIDNPEQILRLMAKEMMRKRFTLPAPNDIKRGLGDEAARWGCSVEAFRKVVGDVTEELFKETLKAIRNAE